MTSSWTSALTCSRSRLAAARITAGSSALSPPAARKPQTQNAGRSRLPPDSERRTSPAPAQLGAHRLQGGRLRVDEGDQRVGDGLSEGARQRVLGVQDESGDADDIGGLGEMRGSDHMTSVRTRIGRLT